MIVSTATNVSNFVTICQVLTILQQLISKGVTNFATWCTLTNATFNNRVMVFIDHLLETAHGHGKFNGHVTNDVA